MRCPNCGYEGPEAPFCVRCGEPLENRRSPYPLEGRGYAASPGESWFSPRIVSSLFPHLPRGDMESFHVGLLLGGVAIVALCSFSLFPLALVVAAALVPLLTVIYLWDVDLYEDEPLPMLAATVLWGAGVGVALGFAARNVTSSPSPLSSGPSTHDVLWLGVVLPLVTVVLALAGPLVLLPYRRFNDVLDGATFGSASAVFALAAEVITNSAGFLAGGLKAYGDTALWSARLVTLGVALPVLAAGTIGAAAGAFWLRFRAPVRDRGRLGVTGAVPVAVGLAAAALVGANLCELYLGQWSTLAIVGLLALLGLVVLRRVIHLGLVEEAAEIDAGPPIRCSNCGRETPSHTFCAHCGISLQALPKAGRRVRGIASVAASRFSRRVVVVSVGALVAGAIGLSVLVIVLVRPAPVGAPCRPRRPCAGPPHRARPRVLRTARAGGGRYVYWTSSRGPSVRYWNADWDVLRQTGTAFVGDAASSRSLVRVALVVSPGGVPAQRAFQAQLDAQRGAYLGLAQDVSREYEILGPEIGYTPASQATYHATLDEPPSPSRRVELAFEAAGNGNATVVVQAVTSESARPKGMHFGSPFPSLVFIDLLLDNFRWAP